MGLVLACSLLANSARAELAVRPDHLPKYDLDIVIDVPQKRVEFKQRVTWTNTTQTPTRQLVFNFYPLYKIPDGESLLLSKTLELLRMQPSYGIDRRGRHGQIDSVRLCDGGNAEVSFQKRTDNQTAFVVELQQVVAPGQSVTVEVSGSIRLPKIQGRWGQWDGITFLTNALPVLAFCDDRGWHDMPFVPWHQPFWNEAGVYTATIKLPENQTLACSADIASETATPDGWKRIVTKPFTGRDFAMVCSAKFHQHRTTVKLPDGREVAVRCLALDRHDFYAKEILRIVEAAIPVYSKWFGAFPYDHFTIVESYFGWNGNECAGLVMIDERVFDMPHLAHGYVEYLVSHETCHQWWYNQVGTNGYAETFMDEGAATYFTHRLIDGTRGKNNPFMHWPKGGEWLPNINRDNYRFSGIYGAIRREDAPAAAGPLPDFGHLAGLFSGAYDRGSKVFGMIESRLGEEAFLDFIRTIVKKYSFRVLSAQQLKEELIAYAGPESAEQWNQLFDRWVYDRGLTDWAVDSVKIRSRGPRQMQGNRLADGHSVRVEVQLSQNREYDEPTTLGFQFADADGFPVRIPIGNPGGLAGLERYDVEVEPKRNGVTTVRLTLPAEPTQVMVDPDRILLDANPANNVWNRHPNVRIVPFYSFLYDTDLTNDYDRWNINAGPWIYSAFYSDPWFTRATLLGARVGAYRTQTFTGGAYAAFRPDYRDLVVGVDGLIDHWPTPRTQVGFNYEQRVGGPYGGNDGEQTAKRAVLYARYVLRYGSSLYLPPFSYVDGFTAYQDNFLPNAREQSPGAQRPDWSWLNGVHYRLNLYTPYWDPERGIWVDLTYAAGTAKLDNRVGAQQMRAELATAQKLPDGLGYFSDIKFAARGVVQGAFPERGQFFALGGSTLFRGFDLAQRQGSFLWVVNAEARLPLARNVRWNVADDIVGGRNLSLALFYDVGAIYNDRRNVGGVAHAVGAGLRLDLAFFSFIERATIRLDVSKTINAATPVQIWYGVQHPF